MWIKLGEIKGRNINAILDIETRNLVTEIYSEIMKEKCIYCGELQYNIEKNQGPGTMYGYHCSNAVKRILFKKDT